MKKIILSTLSILLLGLILTNISCEKLEIKRVTKLNTGEAKDIGYFKATIEGTIVDLAENTGEIGHCWDTLSEPDVNKNAQAMDGSAGQGATIHTEITNLRPDQTYYVRAYARNNNETVYGKEINFKTNKLPNYSIAFNFLNETNKLWPIGKTRTISWTTDIPGAFQLTLLKQEGGNFIDVAEIATTADGARTYDYVLPTDKVTEGNYYAIRVKSVEFTDFYDFKIFKATNPSISITTPNANTKWNLNREYNIEWTSKDIDRVDIKLYKAGAWVQTLVEDQATINTQNWSFMDISPGTDYQIKINYTDFPDVIATSDNFEILGAASITVTAPIGTDDWQTGSTHDITWTDNIVEDVRIELYKGGTLATEIVSSTESDGLYSWTIPSLSTGTDYSIKITMIGDDVIVDDSPQFTITDVIPNTLYLVGSSTDAGWDAAQSIPFKNIEYGKFEIFAHMNTDVGGFKVIEEQDWDHGIWTMADGSPGTLSTEGSGNITHDGVDGFYFIEVDFNTNSYTVTKTDFGISGTAIPPAYSWTVDTDMHYEPPYTWTIDITTVAGEFKFRANDDWIIDFGDGGSGTLDRSNPNNLTATAGHWTITMTLHPINGYTYTIVNATGTVTDIDNNTYNTVKIGNQWWMAENLKVTHYANGDEIDVSDPAPSSYTDAEWAALGDNNTDKAYCYYNNNASGEKDTYGALYTWAAASNGTSSTANPSGVQGICPTGWHLPSDAEWTELTDYLGGLTVAGGKMKATGTIEATSGLWHDPNTGATNESGFTALPGGDRNYSDGAFGGVSSHNYLWSTTADSGTSAWTRYLTDSSSSLDRTNYDKSLGFSVRCVKD